MNAPYFVTKRIVAMEGDIVRTLPPWEDKTVRIPKGHVWVEGDDPTRSRDSNTFGPLPLGLVNGRIDAILSVELGALCSPAAEFPRADAFLPCRCTQMAALESTMGRRRHSAPRREANDPSP